MADESKKNKIIAEQIKFNIYKVMRRILTIIIISLVIFYAIFLTVVDYIYFSENIQSDIYYKNVNNTLPKFIYQFSTSFTIYNCIQSQIIQSSLLVVITFLIYFIYLITDAWLSSFRGQIKQKLVKINQYGLLITGYKQFHRRQQKQIKEYLKDLVQMCLKQRITQFTNSYKKSNKKQVDLIKVLKYSLNKDLIQNVIFLTNYQTSIKDQSIIKDIKRQTTNYLIVLFSYKQIAEVIYKFWSKDKELRQFIKKDVVNISLAPQPTKIMNYKNLSSQTNITLLMIILLIICQVMFIICISGLSLILITPELIFPTSQLSQYWQTITLVLMVAFAILLVLNQYLIQIIIKKILACNQQLYYETNIQNWVININTIIIPFTSFISLTSIFKPDVSLIRFILFGDIGLNSIYLFYFAIKCILFPFIRVILGLIFNSQSQKTKQNYVTKFSTQISIIILSFGLAILIQPIYLLLSSIGFIFKFYVMANNYSQGFFSQDQLIDLLLIKIQSLKNLILLQALIISNFILLAISFSNDTIDIIFLALNASFYGLILLIDLIFIRFQCKITQQNRRNFINGYMENRFRCLFSKIQPKYQQIAQQKAQQIRQDEVTKKLLKQYILLLKQNQQKQQIQSVNLLQVSHIEQLSFKKQKFISFYEQFIFANHTQAKLNLQSQSLYSMKIDNNQINSQLNTMSRTLQSTLRQKLLRRVSDPFNLTSRGQQQDSDFEYERKVIMPKTKQKLRVNIPLLFKPQNLNINQIKLNDKEYQIIDSIQNSKLVYQKQSKNNNKSINKGIKRFKEVLASNSLKQNNLKSQQKQNKQKMIKLTNLFDQDDQSLKQLIRKTIKFSIPKLNADAI